MYICTDFAAVEAIHLAKAPRQMNDVMLEIYPEATPDCNGRYHAPYDGYECPLTFKQFRAGEYLPELSDEELEERGSCGSSSIRTVAALHNGEVVGWEGSKAQIQAVTDELKRQTNAADAASSKHIGSVKDRITVRVCVCIVKAFEGVYGFTYFHVLRSEDGNILIYKGSKVLGKGLAKGDTLKIVATVKGHAEHNGIKQTFIQRPKIAA